MKKIAPNWSLEYLKSNLKTPLFYLYMIYPLLLTGFCFFGVWMVFSELHAEIDDKNHTNHAQIAAHVVGTLFLLRITFDIARYKINKRSWPAILLGIIVSIPTIGVMYRFFSGGNLDDWYVIFISGTIGPLMLFFGFFGYRLIDFSEAV